MIIDQITIDGGTQKRSCKHRGYCAAYRRSNPSKGGQMNQKDIIRMAREAGFNVEQGFLLRATGVDEDLERFAALVRADEREACAKIAKDWVGLNHFDRTLLRTAHAPLKPIYHDKDNSVCSEVVSDWDVFFDAIETKLKEKNHG